MQSFMKENKPLGDHNLGPEINVWPVASSHQACLLPPTAEDMSDTSIFFYLRNATDVFIMTANC